jgi:hypothetical protein
MCWSGALAAGERALAALRGHGRPLVDHVGPMPYARWQQMQDPGAPAGQYYYWKSANYRALSESTLEQLAAASRELPTPRSEIHLQHMGGAVARIPADQTAFAYRDAQFFINVIGIAEQGAHVAGLRDRVRALHDQLSPGASPGVLANFSDQDDGDDVRRFGHGHAARLDSLRRHYDPAGIFAGS